MDKRQAAGAAEIFHSVLIRHQGDHGMGSVRIREKLSGLASETSHYVVLVQEYIWNELLSFKKMFLKDRKIENIMLLGGFLRNPFSRMSRKKHQNYFQKNIIGTGLTRLTAIHLWSLRSKWVFLWKTRL